MDRSPCLSLKISRCESPPGHPAAFGRSPGCCMRHAYSGTHNWWLVVTMWWMDKWWINGLITMMDRYDYAIISYHVSTHDPWWLTMMTIIDPCLMISGSFFRLVILNIPAGLPLWRPNRGPNECLGRATCTFLLKRLESRPHWFLRGSWTCMNYLRRYICTISM